MNTLFKQLKEKIDCVTEKTIQTRRELHQNPETAFEEFNTASLICKRLDELKIPYKNGIAKTGIVALITGGNPGKTIAIRADMDALDMTEETECEYKSKTIGKMHSCGHDAHTAILLSLCEVINEGKDSLKGNVKFIFQPGEEAAGGAKPMIDEGIMDNPKVDACIALHVWPELECGKIEIMEGTVYASPDDFEIKIIGKGGHGAMPHLCTDPILAASYIVTELQSITSRRVNPLEPAVVSICTINAGTFVNIIPDSVILTGTARSITNETRMKMPVWIEETVKNVCQSFNAEYEFDFRFMYPPVVNDSEIAKKLHLSASEVLGDNAIWGGEPTMGGEDFAYFAEIVPSSIFKLGCGNKEKGILYPLHSSKFDLDENCLKIGLEVLTKFITDFLDK